MSESVERKIRYVAAGTIGEPDVLRGLIGDPSVEIKPITLRGFGLRIQRLDEVAQDFVRNDLRAGWDEKRGVPFYGAMTLVEAPEEETVASMVELTPEQWRRAIPRFMFWNYHDYKNPKDGWFGFRGIVVDGEKYYTEMLADADKLQSIDTNYQQDPAYQRFVQVMAEEVLTIPENI